METQLEVKIITSWAFLLTIFTMLNRMKMLRPRDILIWIWVHYPYPSFHSHQDKTFTVDSKVVIVVAMLQSTLHKMMVETISEMLSQTKRSCRTSWCQKSREIETLKYFLQ